MISILILPLKPYQDPAVDAFLTRKRLLIAYSMGLGKTPCAIACAEELLAVGDIDMSMIVVPGSLRTQWAKSIAKFTDVPTRTIYRRGEAVTVPVESSCMIIDGTTPAKKTKQWRYVRDQRPEYVICSYDSVVRDRLARRCSPGLVVLDEATAIKTMSSARTQKVKEYLQPQYRLALSGTAVENRADELFSILEWVDDTVLGDAERFDITYCNRDSYGRPRYRNLDALHAAIQPVVARKQRTDPDVAPFLPEVDHDVWWVDQDPVMLPLYTDMAEEMQASLRVQRFSAGFDLHAYYSGQKAHSDAAMGRIMAVYQAMEMLMDHPKLVEASAARLADPDSMVGSQYCYDVVSDGRLAGIVSSPKLELLKQKVPEILDEDPKNKVLIFSQYRDMQQLIAGALGVPHVFYNGDMNAAEKDAAVARFERDPDCNVFISSHAGAYGTDMYMASHLINYDLPWSAGKADQINNRHVRVASEFSRVFVRDMVMPGSLDHWKHQLLEFKRDLASRIMDGKTGAAQEAAESLSSFLETIVIGQLLS